jgi:methyl-accepting chemotaxis protein
MGSKSPVDERMLGPSIVSILKRLYHPFLFRTIRSRLYLAFGLAACMTVVGSLVALYTSANLSTTLAEVISRSMPATVESLRLAEEARGLVASAPQLMTAEDDDQRNEIGRDIARQSQLLTVRIERLRGLDAGQNDELRIAKAAVDRQLGALDQAVAGRIKIAGQRRELVRLVRKQHEALLDAITPAIDDANFDVMTQMQPQRAVEKIESLRYLLEIQASANFLAGQLIESSLVTDVASLSPIRENIAMARRGIEKDLDGLPASTVKQKISELYNRLAAVAGENGILTQRLNELDQIRVVQQVFTAALSEASTLRQVVDRLTEREGVLARTLSERADRQIQTSRTLLIALGIGAILAATLIAWLYVGRNIVGRLTLLATAMRRIADGEMNTAIPVGGHDEIGNMAKALVIFRQAIAEVNNASQREASRAEESDVRRRQLEAVTRNFERAVNDMVQSLAGASRSMDDCAHIMTQAAESNRAQAANVTDSSGEATANVGSVAMAAEEMAQSVEQISLQAVASAKIAQQATGEAQAVIAAVEQLSSSVEQINAVSNLIRSVAGQTNLLALNAAIEAARAGEAGRGFAVVAQEVKALAAQTEKATHEITQQISTIELTTSNVVQAMKGIAETIRQLDVNATDISEAVQQQDCVTKEIARSASTAAQKTREVSLGIARVAEAALKSDQVATAVLSAGSELAERSNKLRGEVEYFLSQVRVV